MAHLRHARPSPEEELVVAWNTSNDVGRWEPGPGAHPVRRSRHQGSQPSGPDLDGDADPDATVTEGLGSPTGATATASEDPATRGGTDTGPVGGTPAEDRAVDYLTALASADPARRQDAVDAAAPGSPARAYALFQVAQARAIRQHARERSDAEVRSSGDTISLC